MPAFVNAVSGSARDVEVALSAHGGFDVQVIQPSVLGAAVRAAVAGNVPRILVAGGDGTLATAARELVGHETELAVFPCGTLNHFARDLGFTGDAAQALRVATTGTVRRVDVGLVNGLPFLNTSSVGAYVRFVRIREYLERRFDHRLASALAALRILVQFRRITVEVLVNGHRRSYRTPLVFIGAGERELQMPTLGNRLPSGQRGLHVMVVEGRTRARALAMGLSAVARGINTVSKTPEFDSFLVEECTLVRRRRGLVAHDGELAMLGATLRYTVHRDALRVVCP